MKYVEKYQPNKYASIFKEKIFTNNDNSLSFSVKVIKGEEGQPLGGGGGKGAKKGGKDEAPIM